MWANNVLLNYRYSESTRTFIVYRTYAKRSKTGEAKFDCVKVTVAPPKNYYSAKY